MVGEEQLLCFGDCQLDLVRHELRRGGELVEIQPRVFDCLRYLVENHERSVAKQELQDQVWTGQVVTDAAMTRAIMKARRAIGDDGDSPRWIRTLHARGYRFIGPVQRLAAGSPPTASGDADPMPPGDADNARLAAGPATTPASPGTHRQRPSFGGLWLVLSMAALLGVAALVVWRSSIDPLSVSPGDAPVIAVLPVANDTGDPMLDWMELGLMGQLARHLEHGAGRMVVPVPVVLSALDKGERRSGQSETAIGRLSRTTGASHVIAARVERTGQQLQLSYRLHGPDGRIRERILLGGSATELARGLLHDIDATLAWSGGRSPVAEDGLVAETYLRGLALQLEGRSGDAEPYFRQAADAAPASFWPRYELALSVRNQGRTDEAEALLVALQGHPEMTTDWLAQVALHNALAIARMDQLRYDEARMELLGCLRILEGRDDARREAACLGNLGIIARRQDQLDEAEDLLRRAGERLSHLPMGEPGWILHSRALVADRRGDPEAAEALFTLAAAANRLHGHVGHEAHSLAALAEVRMEQERWHDAREPLEQAAALFAAIGDQQRQAARLLDLAGLHLRLQQTDEAMLAIEQCRPVIDELDDPALSSRLEALVRSSADSQATASATDRQ